MMFIKSTGLKGTKSEKVPYVAILLYIFSPLKTAGSPEKACRRLNEFIETPRENISRRLLYIVYKYLFICIKH